MSHKTGMAATSSWVKKKTIYIFNSGPFDLLNFSTFCDIFYGSPYFSNDGINPNEYSFLSCKVTYTTIPAIL